MFVIVGTAILFLNVLLVFLSPMNFYLEGENFLINFNLTDCMVTVEISTVSVKLLELLTDNTRPWESKIYIH